MTTSYHAIVWIDHEQAKIFHVSADDVDFVKVRSTHPHVHLHHKANSVDSGHAAADLKFFAHVAEALAGTGAIVLTGPAGAKQELADYIQRKEPDLFRRISGVETSDHPSDGQLVAFARRYFKADDRMHSQKRD